MSRLSYGDISVKEDRYDWNHTIVLRENDRLGIDTRYYINFTLTHKVNVKAVYRFVDSCVKALHAEFVRVDPAHYDWIVGEIEREARLDNEAEEHIAATGGYGR
jgi:hypothetical protein